MKPSLLRKLDQISERHQEITALLAEPEIQADQNKFRDLTKEYAQLEPVVECYNDYRSTEESIASAREMLDDPEMAELAEEELKEAEERLQQLSPQLQLLLIPPDTFFPEKLHTLVPGCEKRFLLFQYVTTVSERMSVLY